MINIMRQFRLFWNRIETLDLQLSHKRLCYAFFGISELYNPNYDYWSISKQSSEMALRLIGIRNK